MRLKQTWWVSNEWEEQTEAIVRHGPRAPMSNPMPHIVSCRKEANEPTLCVLLRTYDKMVGCVDGEIRFLCVFNNKKHQKQEHEYATHKNK